jgi:tight adherence protein C
MSDQLIFLLCICGAAAGITYAIFGKFVGKKGDSRLRERLLDKERPAENQVRLNLKEAFQRVGQAAAQPFMPDTREKQGALRRKLAMAGIYSPSAVRTVTGCKVIFLVLGLLIGYAVGMATDSLLICLSIFGLMGYLLPQLWLKAQVAAQQKGLEYGLPDALDLILVCVEAGLAVDAAMQRVGQELSIAHPRLSREMEITHMETRVGLSRADALRNLGQRTGSAPLQSLASMIVQAERFGTSIAGALRVHGESLRIARQHKAEEMAAKSSVKMSFPLVLFIFPATFIVLAGPTIVGLLKSSLMN